MRDYRRWFVDGGSYFFAVVTHRRRPLFADAKARRIIGEACGEMLERRPMDWPARGWWIILPDHLHFIWTLRTGDDDFFGRMAMCKISA